MIIKKPKRRARITVDLTGPEGNAYCLMAYASQWAKQQGKDAKAIVNEMMSGDYEHLLEVIDREFGDIVTFYR